MTEQEQNTDVDIPDIFTLGYITISDGAKLRRISYNPENPKGIVFLYPGLNTLVLSWIKVLNLLSDLNYRIEYIESREKASAILEKSHEISKERMLEDCAESISLVGLEEKKYIALGSSLGSMTLIMNMARGAIKPPHVILVGPPLILVAPLSLRIILFFLNDFIYGKLGRPLVKFVLLRKFTNKEADPLQHRKYELAIHLAIVSRLKKAIYSWYKTTLYDELNKVDGKVSKCYLIGASKDKLHKEEDTHYIANNIENAIFKDLETNTAAHDQPLIDFIEEINQL